MVKKRIQVNITSTERNQAYNAEAEYKNNRYIFDDPEGNKNFIIFKQDIVEYHKQGSVQMKYTFDPVHPQIGTYKVDGYSFSFMIHTKKMTRTTNNIAIEFELFQEDELINTVDLRITIDSM